MASARVRKAFRYPEDATDTTEVLNEEEQEELIATLKQRDTVNSALYLRIYTCVPAACALTFLATIFTADSAKQRGIALLSFSSIAATTYQLLVFPLAAPDRKGKKPVYVAEMERRPVERYLPGLNAVLAGLLLISAVLDWRQGSSESAMRQALPAIVLAITVFVREQLRPLDWHELEQARYELKGA